MKEDTSPLESTHITLQRRKKSKAKKARRIWSSRSQQKNTPAVLIYSIHLSHNSLVYFLYPKAACSLDLDDVLESTVDRAPDRLNLLPEVDRGDGTLADALRSELKLRIHLLVRARGTEAVETERPGSCYYLVLIKGCKKNLLMSILLPAER